MTSAGWVAANTSRHIASLPTPTTSATSPPTWPVSPPLRPSTPFFKRPQNFATRCPRTDPSLSSGIPVPVFRLRTTRPISSPSPRSAHAITMLWVWRRASSSPDSVKSFGVSWTKRGHCAPSNCQPSTSPALPPVF